MAQLSIGGITIPELHINSVSFSTDHLLVFSGAYVQEGLGFYPEDLQLLLTSENSADVRGTDSDGNAFEAIMVMHDFVWNRVDLSNNQKKISFQGTMQKV